MDSKRFQIDRKLLPVKVLSFLVQGAVAVSLLWFPIITNAIKIDGWEIILPALFACVGPVAIGFFVDKLGKFRLTLTVALAVLGVLNTLDLMIEMPYFSIPDSPKYVTAQLDCRARFWSAVLTTEHCEENSCPAASSFPNNISIALGKCHLYNPQENTQIALNTSSVNRMCLYKKKTVMSIDICGTYDSVTFLKNFTLKHLESYNNTPSGCAYKFNHIVFNGHKYLGLSCTVGKSLIMRCDAEVTSREPTLKCSNMKKQTSEAVWLYLLLISCGVFFLGVAFVMVEASILILIRKEDANKDDYGKQRMWGYVGALIFIGLFATTASMRHYSTIILAIAAIILIYCGLPEISQGKSALRFVDVLCQFKDNTELGLLFAIVFFLGLHWHVMPGLMPRNSMYLHGIRDGGLAFAAFVCCLILPFVDTLISRLGAANLITTSLFLISLMSGLDTHVQVSIAHFTPGMAVVIIENVSFAISVVYVAKLSKNESHMFTILGLLYSVHHGLGAGAAGLLGLFLQNVHHYVGNIDLIFSPMIAAVAYRVLYHFWVVKKKEVQAAVAVQANGVELPPIEITVVEPIEAAQ